jgi:hypothetical protein
MPTTRPGYVWSGTEWIAIGQEAVVAPVSYQATAPISPATGDIWIESDVDVPSIDSAQFLRWRKTMVGGETSLSGNDDLSLPLAYAPGYEQLYINGVLQVRGQDYTATTGTTVTGLTALVVNDVVEIFSAVARTVADVYTQTQSDARFIPLLGNLRIKQIVTATYASQVDNTTTTFIDTGLTATITPTSTTSKVVVLVSHGSIQKTGANSIKSRLMAGATQVAITGDVGFNLSTYLVMTGNSFLYVDTPGSLAAKTYKTQFNNPAATATASVQVGNSQSTIILIEVEA